MNEETAVRELADSAEDEPLGAQGDMPLCEENELHSENISRARENLPAEEDIYDAAELFKVFGDSTRMKIMYLLLANELCVCDIAEILGVSQSAVSHQLRVLKQSRLIRCRRRGRSVFYSPADDHVRIILNNGMEHIKE